MGKNYFCNYCFWVEKKMDFRKLRVENAILSIAIPFLRNFPLFFTSITANHSASEERRRHLCVSRCSGSQKKNAAVLPHSGNRLEMWGRSIKNCYLHALIFSNREMCISLTRNPVI